MKWLQSKELRTLREKQSKGTITRVESTPQNLWSREKTRDNVARFVDTSHDTLSKLETILQAAEENREIYQQLVMITKLTVS